MLNLLELWLSLAHLAIPIAAFSLAGYIRFMTGYFSNRSVDPTSYVTWVFVVTLVWALVVKQFQLNRVETIATLRTGIKATGKAIFYTMVVVLALSFFYRQTLFSRIFTAVGCALMFIFSLVVLQIFRSVVLARRGPFKRPLRIAIVGADHYAARVAQHLESHPLVAVEVACFVSLDHENPAVCTRPVLDSSRMEEIADTFDCREVLVALPQSRFSELKGLLQQLRHLCVPVRVVLDMDEAVFVPERIFNFYGLPLLDIRPYPVDTVSYTVGKRIFDIVFSTLALLVAGPVMAAIAAVIKLTSPGPVFFSQERISLNGKRFKMLKFRTMCEQDPDSSSTRHTSRDDPRITRNGHWLRKTSLDELPQFFNVLRGDMSVVGPRPELIFFVQKFRQEIPAYMARHNVKCGITGLAQINGFRGSDTSIRDRIEHDLYYLQNWSMLLDLRIILQTVFKGLISKSAY